MWNRSTWDDSQLDKSVSKYENPTSSSRSVKSGPQGSVLGPILFVIFINDMPDIVGTIYQLFSNDAKLYRSIISPEDNRKLQDDLDGINEWSTRWQLPFIIDKCKSLHISRKISGIAMKWKERN